MSRSKVALITAAILTTIGITGAVVTGIAVLPTAINDIANDIKNNTYIEAEVGTLANNVEKLNININTRESTKVEIRKSSDENTRIKTHEINKYFYNIKENYLDEDKSLTVVVENENTFNGFDNIEQIFKRIYPRLIGYDVDENLIIIEVPNQVDINISSKKGVSLDIRSEEVLKDDLIINSSSSRRKDTFNIPNNNIKNFKIINNSYMNLELSDFINAENVEIQGGIVSIDSKDVEENYDLTKLPNKVNIRGEGININSYIPLGKEVNIYSQGSCEYISNFQDYNFIGTIESKLYNNEEDTYNREKSSNMEIELENLDFKLENGKYTGKFSKAEGEQFDLNITAYNGKIINDSKINIVNGILMNRRR